MQEPRAILESLGLNDSESDVYLAMQQGVMRVADIVRTTGRKRPTVYYAIDCLEKRGLLNKTGAAGESVRLEPLSRLVGLAQEKKREADELLADASKLSQMLAVQAGTKGAERPAVAFYEGVEAVKNVVMEALYCKDKRVDVVAPHDNFFQQVGAKFVEEYVELRGRRGIVTRSLWEQKIDMTVFKKYYAGRSLVGLVPKVMRGKFKTTVVLYDDKALYVSSKGSAYCVLITSKEHHDTMRAWFEALWDTSTPHPSK